MRLDVLTCVCNGQPFIRHHLPMLEALKSPWHWHVFEAISRNLFRPETIAPDMHRNGLSVDGTTEYITDHLMGHPNVTVYRPGVVGRDWRDMYLTARFQHMLSKVTEPTLALEIDVDEFYTTTQIETLARMFDEQPTKTAAWVRCRLFVGPKLMLPRSDWGPGGRYKPQRYEWKRAWRHRPGIVYAQHDPPVVLDENGADQFETNPFLHDETEAAGLVFNHYAYVTEAQVAFKERRYAFHGAVQDWRRLQKAELPTMLGPLIGGATNPGGHSAVIAAPPEYWFKEE